MKTFIDNEGKTWKIRMTIGACEEVKDTLGFDLLHPEAAQGDNGQNYFERLVGDSLFDYKIILALCKKSIVENGYDKMSAAEIGELFDAEVFKSAREAFYQEYQDFFRLSGKNALASFLEKILDLEKAQLDALDAKTKLLDSKQLVEDAMKEVEDQMISGQ